ncbi:unnamed protein product [Caenorhabditis bovis]|uniref:Uncharacterized protein n=1 Tax=Caenorhabditis bovis TaxID=2654633 RepID=A0A8S1F335_9PELO|nr:unnamed protein product [Caenorhabditis bovis]
MASNYLSHAIANINKCNSFNSLSSTALILNVDVEYVVVCLGQTIRVFRKFKFDEKCLKEGTWVTYNAAEKKYVATNDEIVKNLPRVFVEKSKKQHRIITTKTNEVQINPSPFKIFVSTPIVVPNAQMDAKIFEYWYGHAWSPEFGRISDPEQLLAPLKKNHTYNAIIECVQFRNKIHIWIISSVEICIDKSVHLLSALAPWNSKPNLKYSEIGRSQIGIIALKTSGRMNDSIFVALRDGSRVLLHYSNWRISKLTAEMIRSDDEANAEKAAIFSQLQIGIAINIVKKQTYLKFICANLKSFCSLEEMENLAVDYNRASDLDMPIIRFFMKYDENMDPDGESNHFSPFAENVSDA